MATRSFTFSTGEYYHIYNRGTEKKVIFKDQNDYEYFIRAMYFSLSGENFKQQHLKDTSIEEYKIKRKVVSIGAYVLMSNHFHILVKVKNPLEFSTFMNRLQTSYAMYFNNKYERTGSLFQGTFKAQHIDSDTYLKYLFAYLHLNPVKKVDKSWKKIRIDIKKFSDYLDTFKYSSYIDYVNPDSREEANILDKKTFPNYFKTPKDFKKFIDFWNKYKHSFTG